MIACAMSILVVGCGGGDDSTGSAVDIPSTGADPDESGSSTAAVPVDTVEMGADMFDTDFAQVCRGTGQPAASVYEPVAGTHPLVALTSDDGVEFTGAISPTLPTGWSALYPDLASAELVLCHSLVGTTPTELCTGYTDDDKPEAGESSVQMFDATYEISLRVATTAEVLHTETADASDDSCPMLVFFDEDDPDPKPWNSALDDGVIELMVKPFVNPS